MFNLGEDAGICHLPMASLKELHFPWLILKFPDLNYGECLIFLNFLSKDQLTKKKEGRAFRNIG